MTMASDYDNSGPTPQLQKASDHNRSEPEIQDHNNEPLSSKLVPNVSSSVDTTSLFKTRIKTATQNVKHEAKSRLRKLKHFGTIREYVKEFTTLILKILDLFYQEYLFYFLEGLQGCARTELERRGVQDLATAITHEKALIDLSEWRSSKPTNEDSGDEQGGGEKQVTDRDDGARRLPQKEKTSYKSIIFSCAMDHTKREIVLKNEFASYDGRNGRGSV
ncbi:hypothetical protein Tco_0626207 [Tanacetum coccineum]|uniref:Retrotransposon gag domain-containing protein n=1 Tax=Tanacetum coccineum TaxID=301880 RepID=A0ABQ4WIX9_9ASTR